MPLTLLVLVFSWAVLGFLGAAPLAVIAAVAVLVWGRVIWQRTGARALESTAPQQWTPVVVTLAIAAGVLQVFSMVAISKLSRRVYELEQKATPATPTIVTVTATPTPAPAPIAVAKPVEAPPLPLPPAAEVSEERITEAEDLARGVAQTARRRFEDLAEVVETLGSAHLELKSDVEDLEDKVRSMEFDLEEARGHVGLPP